MAKTSLSSPPQIIGADLWSDSSTQLMPLGAYAETPDGRGFRYCKVGATDTVAGKVYQSKALDATNDQPSGGLGVNAAVAIGGTEITTSTSTTWTVNEHAGGYVSINVTPGEGYLYRIKSNTATSAATGGVIVLEDPVKVALTTSSKFIIVQHPYNGVVIEPGTPTGKIVGVAPYVITAGNYGWLQTKGSASVLFTGTGAAGKVVGSLTGGTSGSMAPAIAATNIGGEHMATGITAEYAIIYLTID